MTDQDGWGDATCGALDDAGDGCVLDPGHTGNHRTIAQYHPPLSYWIGRGAVILGGIVVILWFFGFQVRF